MTKIIYITKEEEKILFTPKELKFLKQSWVNYQYHITKEHEIYLHLLPKDISNDTANNMIAAIEHTHPCATELWIYRAA